MPITNIGVANNVPLQLKKDVNKVEFKQNVDNALQDNKLTKTEYKQLKDSMVNGRQSLNELLSQVGVASKSDLQQVFAKKKDDGSVNITPLQKSLINSIISDKSILTDDVKGSIDEIKKNIVPVDRSKVENRYSLDDVLFSPEISGALKQHCEKEFNSENVNFLHDVKTAIDNPDKETMKEIYNSYVKTGSQFEINLPSSQRNEAKKVFDNPDSSLADMINALNQPFAEIKGVIKNDVYPRFTSSNLKDALTVDMQSMSGGSNREKYFDSFKGTKFETAANLAKQDDFARVLKNLESM